MPCQDLTEILKIKLDQNENLINYSLSKKTCHKSIGTEGLLLGFLIKKSITKIIELKLEEILLKIENNPITEYLHKKHLISINKALNVYIGQPTTTNPEVRLESIEHNQSKETILIFTIKLNLNTAKIIPCGNKCSKKNCSK